MRRFAFVLAISWPFASHANLLDKEDSDRAELVEDNSSKISAEIMNDVDVLLKARGDIKTIECLEEIRDAQSNLAEKFSNIKVLIFISSVMSSADDEKILNKYIDLDARMIEKASTISMNYENKINKRCSKIQLVDDAVSGAESDILSITYYMTNLQNKLNSNHTQ